MTKDEEDPIGTLKQSNLAENEENILRLLTYKQSEQKVHCIDFFMTMDLYKETGYFVLLADAFLICQEKGYELPDELLLEMTKHFREFVDADKKETGLAALGFGNNKDGGAWQGKAARAKANQAQILSLISDFEIMINCKKKDIFKNVASICKTTSGRVKDLYYKSKS